MMALVLGVSMAATSFCDLTIFTPTAKKLRTNQASVTLLTLPSRDYAFGWAGLGLSDFWEVSVTGENLDSSSLILSGNLSYHYLIPIVDVSPGIALGVIDVADETEDRRAFYAAFTFHFGNIGTLNQDVPTEFTLGMWSRKEGFMFFGAKLPVTSQFKLVAEHDANRFNSGIEFSPISEATFKYYFRAGSPMFGLTVQKRF
ncbi:hypothetical protein QM565_14345 [Geitlerinema splendidum]|nr:hypothetical protein [Geitlerinema splendidum]